MLSVQCLPTQCRCKFSGGICRLVCLRAYKFHFRCYAILAVVLLTAWEFQAAKTMPVPPQLQKFIGDVDKALHEPGKFTDTLGQVEAKTNVKRIYTVGGTFQCASAKPSRPASKRRTETVSLNIVNKIKPGHSAKHTPLTSNGSESQMVVQCRETNVHASPY